MQHQSGSCFCLVCLSLSECINIITVTDLPKTGLLHTTLFLFTVLIYFILKVKKVSFRLAKGVFQIYISWCLGLLPTLTPFPFPVCWPLPQDNHIQQMYILCDVWDFAKFPSPSLQLIIDHYSQKGEAKYSKTLASWVI